MPCLKVVEKIWGREEWLVNNELYCLKTLIISPGGCCSLHYHKVKDETFVSQGNCFLEIGGNAREMTPGDTQRISPCKTHRFWVLKGGVECRIMEVSTHHDDADVVRLEESKILTLGQIP